MGGGIALAAALALIVAGIVLTGIREEECQSAGFWIFEVEECHQESPYYGPGMTISYIGIALLVVGIVITAVGLALPPVPPLQPQQQPPYQQPYQKYPQQDPPQQPPQYPPEEPSQPPQQ